MADENRRAPIQGTWKPKWHPAYIPYGTITWTEHLQVYACYAARYGRNQSAEKIADRGGFGFQEATDLLGRPLETFVANKD